MSPNILRDFAEPLDLSSLRGRTISAFAQHEDYWHTFVALEADDGTSIVFETAEHSAGHWFEVFPILYAVETSPRAPATTLPAPMTIISAEPLWRLEWTVPGTIGPSLGSGGNTQYAGRGPVPPNAESAARVLAGVLMKDASGQRLVVASSDSAPFNVEFAYTDDAVERMLRGFDLSTVS